MRTGTLALLKAGSSDAQRRLIKNVAAIALAGRPEILTEVNRLLKRSSTLAKKRNRIIHAFYDRPFVWTGGTSFRFDPIAVDDFDGALPKPDSSYSGAVAEFYRHANEVRDFWLRFHALY